MQVTKDNIFSNQNLKDNFSTICEDATWGSTELVNCHQKVTDNLFRELLSRVINTMMNSLIQSAAILDRIAMNKGVDANVALRDKLKVYAAEKDSYVKL